MRHGAIRADKSHCWHPFTQMRDWCAAEHEPLVLLEGEGAVLRDSHGREYIDGNSSIWTNLHGHRHPRIDAAIRAQLERVAHTSFLGFTNPPAAQLARELAELWAERGQPAREKRNARTSRPRSSPLTRCFFSDDGSTAIEVSLKMAAQFWQLSGQPERRQFVAFTNAYHGDTMGASSLGGISAFHGRFAAWQFPATFVSSIEEIQNPRCIAAVVIEPLIQGAAGMRLWPRGMLAQLRAWCDAHGVLLIADEVMTGFGRTGTMFACEQEGVVPDFVALAKGLTGGYMPLAATLTSERVFEMFLGGPERTLFYGHSYTGNQLGCAAALANLAIFREERVLDSLAQKITLLGRLLAPLRAMPQVRDVRQCGFIAGIEVERDGAKVCLAARELGLLTRPIRDVVVLMPPYCISEEQLRRAVAAVRSAIEHVIPA